jgi:hypothetical protein
MSSSSSSSGGSPTPTNSLWRRCLLSVLVGGQLALLLLTQDVIHFNSADNLTHQVFRQFNGSRTYSLRTLQPRDTFTSKF